MIPKLDPIPQGRVPIPGHPGDVQRLGHLVGPALGRRPQGLDVRVRVQAGKEAAVRGYCSRKWHFFFVFRATFRFPCNYRFPPNRKAPHVLYSLNKI